MGARRDDDTIFGKWVYCNQHRSPHTTGWCPISNRDKLGLGVETEQEAYAKCRQFRLPIYNDDEYAGVDALAQERYDRYSDRPLSRE